MSTFSDLLDLDTLVKVRKAAPQVTVIPFDMGFLVVNSMVEFSEKNDPNTDANFVNYWQASVKEIIANIAQPNAVALNQVGRTAKALGLEHWRKTDGAYVAWSKEQLDLLKKYFKIG